MAEHTLTVRYRAVMDGYERALDSAGRKTEQFASKADRVEHLGKQYEDMGGKISRGVTLPAIAAGGAALMVAGNFEASLREIQALTGATASEMSMLETQAVRLGASTQFSASEVADAMSQLIKGGFDVRQTYQALPGVLQLAAAGSLDIASAADIATNVLSGYRMEVGEVTRVNDVLAQTANASDTDVRELGEAFKMVGPIAAGAGIPLEGTAAILGLLAENGIRGTMAGTALRGIIASLAAPSSEAQKVLDRLGITVFDNTGKMRPLVDIIAELNAAGADTTDVYQLFGRETAGAMQALLSSGAPALTKFTTLLEESRGVAQNLADAKMGGFTGAVEELKGSLETLAISVGNSGVLGFATDLAGVSGDLITTLSGAPAPLLATASGIIAIAAASGPAIWAAGKMATMYRPVVSGTQDLVLHLMVAREQFGLARAAGTSMAGSLTTALGPGAPVLVGIALLGGLVYLLKKHSDDLAKSHIDAGSAAMALAASANIATRELSAMNDETADAVVSTDDWRRQNEAAIATILAMDGMGDKQAFLVEIGYQMVLRGATPEEAVDQVTRLAEETGVEIPVGLTVEGVGEFDAQLQGVSARARRFASEWSDDLDNRIGRSGVKSLDDISKAAQEAFATDNVAGWAAALGEAESQLGSYTGAINYLADRSLNDTEISGLSQRNASNLLGVLQEITSEASTATESQKAQAQAILDTAAAMDGGLTPANVRAAAAQAAAGYNASTFGAKAADAAAGTSDLAGVTDELTGEIAGAGAETDAFAAALDRMAGEAALARMDIDAAAAAAEAYATAVENSTSMDDQLSAGIGAGRALKALHEGLTGQERLADAAEEAADSTRDSRSAVDELGDAARRTDPKLTALQIRLGALRAASDAFRQSLSDSTWMDDQAIAALDLGDAFEDFERIARRLPKTFDPITASAGAYRKRETEAVRATISLGKAAHDYLATLLEMGHGQAFVQAEAARLRAEFEAQLRQVGMNEDQIAAYIRMMGMAPDQITTAIEVAGLDSARFQVDAYLQLLEGRIPDSIATSVIASLDAGDVQGAANQLSAWAKTNPVRYDVKVGVDDSGLQEKTDDIKASLWDLPESFDPLAAALGRYTDEQYAALDGIMAAGDGIQDYIEQLVAAGKPQEEVFGQAIALRDELLRQAGMGDQAGLPWDQMTEKAQNYLSLVGMSDFQIESSLTLTGDAEAMFRIQLYTQFLENEFPTDLRTDVLALVDEGKLTEAAQRLADWRLNESQKKVHIQAVLDATPADRKNIIGAFPGNYEARIPGNAAGGRVVGPGTETSDSVLRRLSNNEFVIKASSARRLGYENLAAANDSGVWPGGLTAAQLAPAGGAFSDTAIVAELRDLRSAMARIQAGYTIERLELVSSSPRRAAEDLLQRGDAIAKAQRLVTV